MTILFDLDGTLIDSTEAILESFHRTYDLLGGRRPDDEAIKALIGHPLEVMYAELGADTTEVETYVSTYKAHYRRISCEKTVLLSHAREAVEEAAAFARLGIVTTKTGQYSRELLEHLGLMERFEVLIGREHVTLPKPHPEPIETALAAMKASKENCWLIGDTRLDVEAASAAGIGCVAVSCGYETEAQLTRICTHVKPHALAAVRYIANR